MNDLLFEPLTADRFAILNDYFADLVSSSDAAVGLIRYLTGRENGK